MKVLIPNYRSPDSFVDNVADTLERMGVEVSTLPRKPPVSGPVRRVWSRTFRSAFPQRWTPQERFAVARSADWKPDVVLALTLPLRAEVLGQLSERGGVDLVAWWGDAPANMAGMGLLEAGWTKRYLKDASAVDKFRAVGLEAALLDEAMNPAWHHPNAPKDKSVNEHVAIVGNFYGYRQAMISALASKEVPLALFGAPPPRWSVPEVVEGYRNEFVVRERKSSVFRSALAVLNSTSLAEGDTLNCRAFEACGAGALHLLEPKKAVSRCFEPGVEVLTYTSVDDLVEITSRASADPAWAAKIRDAGSARAHAHHKYEDRLRIIFQDLERALPA